MDKGMTVDEMCEVIDSGMKRISDLEAEKDYLAELCAQQYDRIAELEKKLEDEKKATDNE